VSIVNGSDTPVSFWLFPEDIESPLLGREPPPSPQVASVPEGTDFYHPTEMVEGLNRGGLEPGEVRYYAFGWGTLPSLRDNPMHLTMFFTPEDGNRGRKVGFDLVAAQQVHLWARGDGDQVRPFGVGSSVSRDGSSLTGEMLWSGRIIYPDTYYVRVYNGSESSIDYWLFTDDVSNVTLGSTP